MKQNDSYGSCTTLTRKNCSRSLSQQLHGCMSRRGRRGPHLICSQFSVAVSKVFWGEWGDELYADIRYDRDA